MNPLDIPDKLYFRIGEVSEIVGVKPYVLRYWETEFNDIKPTKSKSGQRLYKKRDVEFLLRIKELLYEEGYTINGARQKLKELMKEGKDLAEEDTGVVQGAEAADGKGEELSAGKKEVAKGSRKLLLKLKGDLQKCLEELQK